MIFLFLSHFLTILSTIWSYFVFGSVAQMHSLPTFKYKEMLCICIFVLLYYIFWTVAHTLCVFTFWVSCYDYDFRIKNDVRFVFTSSCLWEGSCLIYVICDYLRILVSNTYCVVFLFCFTSSCVPYCPFVIAPSVFSNAYWTNIEQHYAHVFTTSYRQKYCIAYYYNAYYTEQQPTAKTKCIFDFKLN
jgi:hypothetical protein